jgi:hypothetical protein
MDFPLDQDQEVRLDRDVGAGQCFHETGHIAASIDDPLDAFGLQLADELLELFGDWRIFEFGKQGAVEIRRD